MTLLARVVGNPIGHSLSPLIHGAWIAAAGIDACYEAILAEDEAAFRRLVEEGAGRGFNVTIPFKEAALAAADTASDLARLAGAANLLVFAEDGSVFADNTDGPGLLAALKVQAGFEPTDGPAVILGAGGAAKGAAAALILAGSPAVRIVNRTRQRAQALADHLGERAQAFDDAAAALDGAAVVINATSLGLGGGEGPEVPLERAPGAVVMDMVYKPLRTRLLQRAAAAGHPTVDGLEMLIRQAIPSFEAFFGQPPPGIDVRSLVLARLEGGQ